MMFLNVFLHLFHESFSRNSKANLIVPFGYSKNERVKGLRDALMLPEVLSNSFS